MTWLGEREFLILLLLNALAVVVYLLWCLILKVVFRRNTKSLWLKALVMLLCPVAGICFFLAGYLFYRLFFFVAVDLEDVVFSKDRIDPAMPAEEERESNMVPIEEALAVTDKGKCQGLNAEKSKIVFCALFTKAILPPQYRPPGQAPAIPVRHTSHPGCRAGIRLPTAAPAMCPPLLSR